MNRTLIDEHAALQQTRRLNRTFDRLPDALEQSCQLEVPPPVTDGDLTPPGNRGVRPKLSAEAYELARQVYYLHHGSRADCARAIIDAGLALPDDTETRVRERLQTWWKSRRWPIRPTTATFVLRDAAHDGGLYRGEQTCIGTATGNGPAPAGKPCPQNRLADSDYCYHHDPRPEYVARRAQEGRRLAAARSADMVPLQPLQQWMRRRRGELLEEAKRDGAVHHRDRGWGRLAAEMGLDPSQLKRVLEGRHRRHPEGVSQIRAKTVVAYLHGTPVSFRDVYGFDPPQIPSAGYAVCPACGGSKNHESRLCRSCWEVEQGPVCPYVNQQGVPCDIRAKHPSGYCAKHRRLVEREPKPRTGRPTRLTAPRLILALDAYRHTPNHAYVAKRMWAVNAGDVHAGWATSRSLAGTLVKQFRKRGIGSAAQADELYAQLVAEHGAPSWPDDVLGELPAGGMLPAAPFRAWLQARLDDVGPGHGAITRLAERVDMHADTVSQLVRGVKRGARPQIRHATVAAALHAWEDGTTVDDVYAEVR